MSNERDLRVEIWKAVPSNPAYEASSHGRIRSLRTCNRWKPPHILRPRTKRAGYLGVALTENGKLKHRTIHSVVAETFLGSRPSGKVINHKDCDKANNRPENLEYVTVAENEEHARINGLKADSWRPQLSAASPSRKLEVDQVIQIRKLKQSGVRAADLAVQFGVRQGQIHRICSGKRWGWL